MVMDKTVQGTAIEVSRHKYESYFLGRLCIYITQSQLDTELKLMMNEDMIFSGTSGNLTLFDLTPEGKDYPDIIHVDGEKMVDFKVSIGAPNPGGKRILEINSKINSIRFIFLNRFITELYLFANEIQETRKFLEDTAQVATEKALETAQNVDQEFQIFFST